MWQEIVKFEIRYRAQRLDTYLYFTTLFLFSLIGVDFVFEGVDLGQVKENAPYVLSSTMAALSGIFMMIISMIMGVAVLRDQEHQMESMIFINPITKKDYLLGRFLGSFIVLVFIFTGLLLGMILSEYMPWKHAEDLLPFKLGSYVRPFLFIVLPTLFYGSAIFFASGALSKNLIIVYTQGLVFLIFMLLSRSIPDPFWAGMLDPFALAPIKSSIGLWTATERNAQLIPMNGLILYNRIFWIIIGLIGLIIVYKYFSFNVLKDKKSKHLLIRENRVKSIGLSAIKIPIVNINFNHKTDLLQLYYHTIFHFKSILKEASFWAIIICGWLIIFINAISLEMTHGVNSYPKTYLIIAELQEMSIYFFLIMLVFYSGELIWKERTIKMDVILDALPMSDSVKQGGKFLGLILIFVVLMLALILSGIFFQTINNYYEYELGVYFSGFFLEVFPFLLLFTLIAFFFQVVLNHKFLSYLAVLLFFISIIILEGIGFGHNLFQFGGDNLETYSDMNGYGHFLIPYLWFKGYWLLFGALLFVIIILFSIRGKETSRSSRWKLAKQRFSTPLLKMSINLLALFMLLGSFIFYNTNILNTYWSIPTQEKFIANYEKTLKQFEYLPQPKVIAVNLKVDLYPKTRKYIATGYYQLTNTTALSIKEIHIQKTIDHQITLDFLNFEGGAKINKTYEKYSYYIYRLAHPLQPGDSLQMNFQQTYVPKGFEESGAGTKIVENGTFFNNDELPTLGYNNAYELRVEKDRKAYGLSKRRGRAKKGNAIELVNGRSGDDGYVIDFEIIMSTDSDQIAIAPGQLIRKWKESGRNFFHYKMNCQMVNFYSMVSANYELMQDHWVSKTDSLANPVNLEIYYHKGHEYNLNRMMNSMKLSLDYFTKNFGPYPYHQTRIMEVPRYLKSAQSYPNTIPYSESIGFIMDIDDKKDVDMPFFITAHEIAHQWWGLQVIAANVEGRKMILESLAQYSAIMVLKENFPEEKVQQLLKMERKRYLEGRGNEIKQEVPLSLVDNQNYICYRKGGINLYALQEYISEDSVNLALSRFIKDWNSFEYTQKKNRYATSDDLLAYFRAVTPDSLQYIIKDLFETITLFDNKTIAGTYEKIGGRAYKVKLSIETNKYQVDSLGLSQTIKLNDWINIGVYTQDAYGKEKLSYLKKHKIVDSKTQLEIILPQKPIKAGIDPTNLLIEKIEKDNVIVVTEMKREL